MKCPFPHQAQLVLDSYFSYCPTQAWLDFPVLLYLPFLLLPQPHPTSPKSVRATCLFPPPIKEHSLLFRLRTTFVANLWYALSRVQLLLVPGINAPCIALK